MKKVVQLMLLMSAMLANGCTIAGAAIGASMPRYETARTSEPAALVGKPVRVYVRTVGADAPQPQRIEGRYAGIDEGVLRLVRDDGQEEAVALRDVIRVDVRDGTEWKNGLALGAVAEVCIAVAAVALATKGNAIVSTGER